MIRKAVLLATVCILVHQFQGDAFGWGDEGHEVVVRIALRLMDSVQREKVFALLETDDPRVIGNWADIYGRTGDTARWHYVNIPAKDRRYRALDCRDVCLISQLKWAESIVRDHRHSKSTRRKALFWWFHLVGDLYQPFHCYDNNDAGGNRTNVYFRGDSVSLHRLWDSGIITSQGLDATALESIVTDEFQSSPEPDETFTQAADRSHKRAIRAAAIAHHNVTKKYLAVEWPVILRCLWEAGEMASRIGEEL